MNARALKLKENSAEFDTKLADIKRLKNAFEAYLRRNFYFERLHVTLQFQRVIRNEFVLMARAGAGVADGVSFDLFRGDLLLKNDAQLDLDIVRSVYANMDYMIELAEELCKKINRLNSFKAFLKRFDVE
ncbi:MAG: hypothetical protein AAB758_00990 [Patescibacteria group bacterium]